MGKVENENIDPQLSLARNGKSFHWASRILGADMGRDGAKLYAFCRLLDDLADDDIPDGPTRLGVIHADLKANRPSGDPTFAQFQPFMEEKGFRKAVLVALIDGLLQDQEDTVALASEGDLVRYAYRVAGTVGLLMCQVLNCHEKEARAHAIDLGIAMQLTNIARDILEDAQMGRRYIPEGWVDGISPQSIAMAAGNPTGDHARKVQSAVKRLLALADIFYKSGSRGYRYLPWRAHLAIAVAARVYRQIGVQLKKQGYNWHAGRQVTTGLTKARVSLPALFSLFRRMPLPRAISPPRHDPVLHRDLRGLPDVG